MKTFDVQITGTTPLLQHRFTVTSEQDRATRKVLVANDTPRAQADKVAYRDSTGHFFFPGAAIARLIREAGGTHKLKGTRRSAKYVVPAAVLVREDAITLLNGDGKTPVRDFEVDSRPVTIPATKGRIMRHRPRFDCWSARFTIRINEELLPPDFIHQLLVEGGQQIGIGDFRPEKGGPFGTFNIVGWKEAK